MCLPDLLRHYFNPLFRLKVLLVFFSVFSVFTLTACSTQSHKEGYNKYQSTDLKSVNTGKKVNTHPTNKTQQACSDTYKVVRGDSLSEIAAKCHIKMSRLAKANGLSRPYTIHIGQTLSILKSDGSVVATRPVQNKLPNRAQIKNSYKKASWQWPMEQKLEHRFLRDSAGITGLSINCFPGMQVLAVADGEVVYVGNAIMQYGLMVMLKHPSGHMSVYAHNSMVQVKEGQQVKAGQRIATSGGTGLTERPKLYVEARYKGKKVDIKRLFK
ncbi:MAG: peptidoglycan DD-metalloendopeptidase family protein [Pseudomonadota bacterium]|nr:peptidoglycan DD-metalloendopeptidase family protein [Pseudomonadota bacterium]